MKQSQEKNIRMNHGQTVENKYIQDSNNARDTDIRNLEAEACLGVDYPDLRGVKTNGQIEEMIETIAERK